MPAPILFDPGRHWLTVVSTWRTGRQLHSRMLLWRPRQLVKRATNSC